MGFTERFSSFVSGLAVDQKTLAELLGVGASSISAYKKGLAYPSADVLIKIATMYHISIDWLLLGRIVTWKESPSFNEHVAEEALEYNSLDLARKIRRLSESEIKEVHDFIEFKISKSIKASQDQTRQTSG